MPNDKSWLDALSGGPLNVLNYPGYAVGATQFAGNALSNIARSMSPVRFEDAEQSPVGQAGFVPQVPPMISETAGAWGRLFGEQDNWYDGPGEVYPGDQNADAATAALAFYGGNALNPLARVPRGSVASGAVRAGDNGLPMSPEARFARAKEQGYDVDHPVYHGTATDFDAFDLGMSGASNSGHGAAFVAPTYKEAKSYAPFDGGVVKELVSRHQNPFIWNLDDFAKPGDNQTLARAREAMPGFDTPPDFRDSYWSNGPEKTSQFFDSLKTAGYDSIAMKYGGRTFEVGVFDPSNLRSIDAAFDPARAGENGLLFSDNKPSILGSAIAGADHGTYTAYKNGGYAGSADYGVIPGAAVVRGVSVPKEFRRQGMASALHGRIQDDLGLPLTPDPILSPEGYEFWKSSYPEALRNYQINESGWWNDHTARDMSNGVPEWRMSGGPNRPDDVLWSDNKPSILGSAIAGAGDNARQKLSLDGGAYGFEPSDFNRATMLALRPVGEALAMKDAFGDFKSTMRLNKAVDGSYQPLDAAKTAIENYRNNRSDMVDSWNAEYEKSKAGGVTPFYYDMRDHGGGEFGHAEGRVIGDTMYFDWLGGSTSEGPNKLGIKGIRDLREQVRKDFPGVKHFVGDRVSGARKDSGNTIQKVKILSDNKPSIMGAATAPQYDPELEDILKRYQY